MYFVLSIIHEIVMHLIEVYLTFFCSQLLIKIVIVIIAINEFSKSFRFDFVLIKSALS